MCSHPNFTGAAMRFRPASRPHSQPGRRPAKVLRRCRVVDASTGTGKVVVNRCMSLDGFIAGPGDAMSWIFDFMPGGVEALFPEIMAATGAALIGRRTSDGGDRVADPDNHESKPGYDAGALFVLTHQPPAEPVPGLTFLSGDIGA